MLTNFHLSAYYNSALGTTANTDCAALADSVLTISNNHFRLTDPAQLVMAYFGSPTAIRARLDSPTLRLPGQPYILPVGAAILPGGWPSIADWRKYALNLPQREEIALQATANPGTTEKAVGIIWSQFTYAPAPAGRVQWVRGTSTAAAVADAWTNVALTLDSSLPTGYWCMIGSIHVSTNAIAHRIIFPGQVSRPGNLSLNAEGTRPYFTNFDSSLGEMGRFVNDNPFQTEVLCNSTDSTHTFYFGLVPVAGLT